MPAILEICLVVVPSNPFSRKSSSAAARIFSFVCSLFRSRFPPAFVLTFRVLFEDFINLSTLIFQANPLVVNEYEYTHFHAQCTEFKLLPQSQKPRHLQTSSRSPSELFAKHYFAVDIVFVAHYLFRVLITLTSSER